MKDSLIRLTILAKVPTVRINNEVLTLVLSSYSYLKVVVATYRQLRFAPFALGSVPL